MNWLDLLIASGGDPRFTATATLSGVDYLFRFDWLDRFDRWSVDIQRLSGEPVIRGQILVANRNILRQIATRYAPPGVLVAASESDEPADLYDLGTRVRMLYGVQ